MNVLEQLAFFHLGISNGVTSLDEDGVTYKIEHNEVRLSCPDLSAMAYPASEFSVLLTTTKNINEVNYRRLTCEKGRIGWIFPINSLLAQALQEEDKWQLIYWRQAIHSLIFDDEIVGGYTSLPELRMNVTYHLDDLYNEDIAIVVLGNGALELAGMSKDSIRVMLLEHGYKPILPAPEPWRNSLESATLETNPELNVRVRRPSTDLLSYHGQFERILNVAMTETNPVSCFLLVYQLIEAMLLIVFDTTMDVYTKSESFSSDPWSLKEHLSKISGERWRLDTLLNDFMATPVDHVDRENLKFNCNHFLITHGFETTGIPSETKALYAVRNVLVHRQIRITEPALADVWGVNLALTQLSFELLQKFDTQHGAKALQQNLEQIVSS